MGWLWMAGLALAVDVPFEEAPDSVQADHQDRFYFTFDDRVVRWTDQEDRVFAYPPPDGWKQRGQHAVSPVDGRIHSVLRRWKNECADPNCSDTYTQFEWKYVQCNAEGQCEASQLASERTDHKVTTQPSYRFEIDTTEAGRVRLKTVRRNDDGSSSYSYRCGSVRQDCDQATYEELPYLDLPTPVDFRCEGSRLVGGELEDDEGPKFSRKQLMAGLGRGLFDAMANIDTSCIFDRTGRPYVFRQGGNRALYVSRVVDGELQPTMVDVPESGAANIALPLGEQGIVSFHYFYRNSYHKGVRATVWTDGMAEPVWKGDIYTSRDLNPGRRFRAASTPQGRIAAAWPNDARKKKEGWTVRTWDSVELLQQDEVASPDNWTARRKNWFVMAGAGAGYAFWSFSSPAPSEEDFEDVVDSEAGPLSSAYEVAPSTMLSATLEARYGSFSFGASYAKGILEDAADEAGLSSKQYERLYGQLGIDKIIKYHDIRVAFRAGRVDMLYDIDGPTEERSDLNVLGSNYRRIDVYLLNTWRIRYGLFNQTYRAALPFYVWAIDEGQTSYRFVDSFPSTLSFNDYGLTVGYSRLDYAAKFENKVTAPFIDADVGLGFSTARLDEAYTPEDTDTGTTPVYTASGETAEQAEPQAIQKSTTFMIPFNLEVGGILLRRTESLRGLGFYGRLGYRVEGSLSGAAGRPSDLDEPALSARQVTNFSRFEVRHGPFFDVGTVF